MYTIEWRELVNGKWLGRCKAFGKFEDAFNWAYVLTKHSQMDYVKHIKDVSISQQKRG